MGDLPENLSAPWSARREADGIWDVVLSDGSDVFTVYGSKAEVVAKVVAEAINTRAQLKELHEDNAKMRKALSFYANHENYSAKNPYTATPVLADNGVKARKAIGGY